MEDSLITRFINKYPNGWCVQGNTDPRWLDFCELTDISGNNPQFFYYSPSFFIRGDCRIYFQFDQRKTKKQIISITEFFDLYENKNQELTYEIY